MIKVVKSGAEVRFVEVGVAGSVAAQPTCCPCTAMMLVEKTAGVVEVVVVVELAVGQGVGSLHEKGGLLLLMALIKRGDRLLVL